MFAVQSVSGPLAAPIAAGVTTAWRYNRISRMCFALLMAAAWLASAPALAQDPASEEPQRPLLRYAGEPIRIPFQCTGDDLQSFAMVCSARVPCPVYLELAAAEPVGARLE